MSRIRQLARLIIGSSLVIGSFLVIVPSANADIKFSDGVATTFGAEYDCNAKTVSVYADDGREVDAPFTTWYEVWVYDFNLKQWVGSTEWTNIDRAHVYDIYNVTAPYTFAWVNFAHWNGTSWEYGSENDEITSDLGNEFCKIPAP